MHSIEFLELNERLWIPENLGECDRRQYLDIAKLVYMYQLAEINLREFRVFALYSLLNMVPEKNELQLAEDEKWENIYRVSEVLDSFFQIDENGKMHLVQSYIHNPVKSVRYKAMLFKGPLDAFEKMTYGQLEDGLGEMLNFHAFGELEYLLRLFAIFYMRPGESYGKYDLDKRVKFFRHLDIRYVYGFYLLFVSFFTYLTKDCVISVDGREIDLRTLFERKTDGNDSAASDDIESLGLRSTSFQLAESGVFGTLNEVREAEAIVVLIRMYDLMLRARREEAERKAAEQKAKSQSN